MAKNDRRNSNKMKRRRGQASKRRTLANIKQRVTAARKAGKKTKKLRPEDLPARQAKPAAAPPVPAASEPVVEVSAD